MIEIEEILKQIEEIHRKKNDDYTDGSDRYQNFYRSSLLIGWFKEDIDRAFAALIGTKLARLASLLGSDKSPNNEPIADSFLDLCTYCTLWYGQYRFVNKLPNTHFIERIPPVTAAQVSRIIEKEFGSNKLKKAFEAPSRIYLHLKKKRTNPTRKSKANKINLTSNVKRSTKKANKSKHK